MGGLNFSTFGPRAKQAATDPSKFGDVTSGKQILGDVKAMTKTNETKLPAITTTNIESDTSQAEDSAIREASSRKGYASTVITGNLKPKTKGKTTLG